MEQVLHATNQGYIKLSLGGRSMTIGQMKDKGRTFFCERSDGAVMRVNNSLGFNWALMSKGTFTRVVVLMVPSGRILETTRENIVQNCTFLEFRKAGMEKQCFANLNLFNRPPQVKEPNVIVPPMPVQGNLFAEIAA